MPEGERAYREWSISLRPLRRVVVEHPVYGALATLADVRCFQEHHVFAVWDFMSLLTALQRRFTCVEVPWVPVGDSLLRRFVNEIVLGEESDAAPGGGYTSHFEWYLAAMDETGANTEPVRAFVALVAEGCPVVDALGRAAVPSPARDFVRATWDALTLDSSPAITAAFTVGREDVIPEMFLRLLDGLPGQEQQRVAMLRSYVERHIEVDGDQHGPLSRRLLEAVCGADAERWHEAETIASAALQARAALWDGVLASLPARSPASAPRS